MITPTSEQMKRKVISTLRDNADSVYEVAEVLQHTPELGFREYRTSAIVADRLRELGIRVDDGYAITGLRAEIDTGRPGPTVAILGELDALPLPEHQLADVESGVAHACGHHAQLTHLLAVAGALTSTDLSGMCGKVVLIATPAEEYVDLAFRLQLVEEGAIEFLGGKSQMIAEGAFEDVDVALMIHATGREEDGGLALRAGMNGLMAKSVKFVGRASHAGMAPQNGINALNAANLALHAIHLQRETFVDEDHVRIHPIMTKGGDAVNVVPADVRLELYVRALTRAALLDAATKTDRGLRAGAIAVGAEVEIENLGGYLPLIPHPPLEGLFVQVAEELFEPGSVRRLGPVGGSTDAGDLSHLIPVLHAFHGGCSGMNHTAEFRVSDPETAYLRPAMTLAGMTVELLWGSGEHVAEVTNAFTPSLATDEYLELMRSMRETDRFTEP